MKGIDTKDVEVRKDYTAPRTRQTVEIAGNRYNTAFLGNYIGGIITNTKEGKIYYLPTGSPFNGNILFNQEHIRETIEYFNEVLAKMKEREKEIADIIEILS